MLKAIKALVKRSAWQLSKEWSSSGTSCVSNTTTAIWTEDPSKYYRKLWKNATFVNNTMFNARNRTEVSSRTSKELKYITGLYHTIMNQMED